MKGADNCGDRGEQGGGSDCNGGGKSNDDKCGKLGGGGNGGGGGGDGERRRWRRRQLRHTHTYWGTCKREGKISDRRESEGGLQKAA